MPLTKTHEAVDRNLEERQGKGFRRHLGASIIGRKCAREIWYTFHWAREVRHRARMLRLFSRGDLEEERFTRWLQGAGVHVVTHNLDDCDPETGKPRQFRVAAHEGHFGGSLDAQLFDTPDFPGQWILGEFKTHNDKSFKKLLKEGVQKAKPEHYAQMQVYMYGRSLPAAMYFAINKNDDDLYTEIVEYDPIFAAALYDKALKIIRAQEPPPRINESSAWYECQWCDYNVVCHSGAPMAKNCRTCVHAVPAQDGIWNCTKYHYPLEEADQRKGCEAHQSYR